MGCAVLDVGVRGACGADGGSRVVGLGGGAGVFGLFGGGDV